MNVDLYEAGLKFRRAVLEHGIPPEQFNSLLRDVCSDYVELKPALLDLATRSLFRDLPFTGTPSQQTLAHDRLLSEMQPLYRDEIVSEIMEFVEGALGYVDLPCVDDEEILDNQQDTANNAHPKETPNESLRRGFAQGQQEYISNVDDGYTLRHQVSPVELNSIGSWSTNSRFSVGSQSNHSLSALGQVTRVLVYQLPTFCVFLMFRILAAVQVNSANFVPNLRLPELVFDYAYNSNWMWVSFFSISFWSSIVHLQQKNVGPLRLELSILLYFILNYLLVAVPLGWRFMDFNVINGAVMFPTLISIVLARSFIALVRLKNKWMAER